MTQLLDVGTTAPIKAWEFEKWLLQPERGAPPWNSESAIVQGFVQVHSSTPLTLPPLRRYVFLDDVDFQELKIEGPLDFSGSQFTKRLLLRSAEVAGELRLDDVEMMAEAAIGGLRLGLDLRGARLLAGLRARRIAALGLELNLSDARVRHQLDLEGARLG